MPPAGASRIAAWTDAASWHAHVARLAILVDDTVAVVVESVADFEATGVPARRAVVAIPIVRAPVVVLVALTVDLEAPPVG